MADEYIGKAKVGIEADDTKFREDLRNDERLFDKFARKVRSTKATASVGLSLKQFRADMAEVRVAMDRARRMHAEATVSLNTRGFTARLKLLRKELADVGREFGGQDTKLRKWFTSIQSIRVQMGFFSLTIRQAIAAVTVLGPLIVSLTGAVTALAGVTGAAATGALAAFGAGLSGAVLSLGGVVAAVKPYIKSISKAHKASTAYATAVDKYGKSSKQAKTAQEQLNNVMKAVPAASRGAITAWSKISDQYKSLTKQTSSKLVFTGVTEGVKTAQALMPQFAAQVNRTNTSLRKGIQNIGKGLRSGEGKGIIDTLMSGFNTALPMLLHSINNLGVALGRVFAAATPSLVNLVRSFMEWSKQVRHGTDDTAVLGQKITNLVGYFKDIVGLLSSAGRLFTTIFSSGAKSGDNMVKSLTGVLDKWNAFLQTTKGQQDLAKFFDNSSQTAGLFFKAVTPLVQILYNITQVTRPVTDAILQLTGALAGVVAKASTINGLRQAIGLLAGAVAGMLIIAKVTKAYKEFKEAMIVARGAIIAFGNATKIGPLLAALRAGLIGVRIAMLGILSNPVVLALTALGIALVIAYKKSETFRNIVNGVFDYLKKHIVDAMNIILVGIFPFGGALVLLWRKSQTFRDIVTGAFQMVKAVVREVIQFILGAIALWLDAMAKIADAASHLPIVGKHFKGVGDKVRGAAGEVRNLSKSLDDLPTNKKVGVSVTINPSWGDLGTGSTPQTQRGPLRTGDRSKSGDGPGLDVSGGVDKVVKSSVKKRLSTDKKFQAAAFEAALGGGGGPLGAGSVHGSGLNAFNKLATAFGLTIGSGFRPGSITSSGNLSMHAMGRARDFPGSPGAMLKFAHYMASHFGAKLAELIHTPLGFGIKNGHRVPLSYWGPKVNADHYDHVHVALASGGQVNPNRRSHIAKGPTSVLYGEEGPAHPEFYISTNPRDKKRSQQLVMQAAQMVFAKGASLGTVNIGAYGLNKGRLSGSQQSVLNTALAIANGLAAGPKATKALIEALFAESKARNLTYGDQTSTGPLQLLASTARGLGVDPRDTAAVVKLFLTRGFTGKGGAIKLAKNKNLSAAQVATMVQGNRDGAGTYSPFSSIADKIGTVGRSIRGQNGPAGLSRADIIARTPVHGRTITQATLTQRATNQVARAETTARTYDDMVANLNLGYQLGAELQTQTKQLRNINKRLKGKLKPETRQRLLDQQTSLTGSIADIKKQRQDAANKIFEAQVGKGFAHGTGLAGLDNLASIAAGTVGLGDDIMVMGSTLNYWKKILFMRTARGGDLAGIKEARDNVNQLTDSIKSNTADLIRSSLVDSDWGVTTASWTTDLADDVRALFISMSNINAAIAKAFVSGNVELVHELQGKRQDTLGQLKDAQKTADQLPFEAALAVAKLTTSTEDDLSALKALLFIHTARLGEAKAIKDYAKVVEEAGAVGDITGQIDQLLGTAPNMATETANLNSARLDLYKTMGGNYQPAGMTISPAQRPGMGAFGNNPTSVNVVNHFQAPPPDPHTWSKGVAWELSASL